jgi:hypothetical protein
MTKKGGYLNRLWQASGLQPMLAAIKREALTGCDGASPSGLAQAQASPARAA